MLFVDNQAGSGFSVIVFEQECMFKGQTYIISAISLPRNISNKVVQKQTSCTSVIGELGLYPLSCWNRKSPCCRDFRPLTSQDPLPSAPVFLPSCPWPFSFPTGDQTEHANPLLKGKEEKEVQLINYLWHTKDWPWPLSRFVIN